MPILGAFILPHPPIVVPEVGRGEEKKIAATAAACDRVAQKIAALRPDTIVVTSPHSVLYADYFHISPGKHAYGDLERFRAPTVRVRADYDTEFVSLLEREAGQRGVSAGTFGQTDADLDHGTVIPLHFVDRYFSGYRLVRIGLSGLPYAEHYRLGQCIAAVAAETGRRVVLLASGDLSHKLTADGPYGYAPEGPQFDRAVTAAMAEGDFLAMLQLSPELCDAAAECGLRSFLIMAGALDGLAVKSELLSYEGPFGVGYGVASFLPTGPDETRCFLEPYRAAERQRLTAVKAAEDPFVRLARLSVETFVRTGKPAELPKGLSRELTGRRAGVFVSLKAFGRLRGCIGTIAPVTDSVAAEILRNGVSACSEDPRFDPVRPEELETLALEAAFSNHLLTAEQRRDTLAYLDGELARIQKEQTRAQRFFTRYWKVLY